MNTRTITRAKLYTRLAFLAVTFSAGTARGEWTVDFSRRLPPARLGAEELMVSTPSPTSSRDPASEFPIDVPAAPATPAPSANAAAEDGFFATLFQSGDVAQEIVVLNTEKGFVPSTIRVKRGLNYKIDVVNVNEKERNVSFVLDSFSEHHGTYYGKIKSFVIRPQKEGVYKFISPETSAQGKLVVSPSPAVDKRLPASAE